MNKAQASRDSVLEHLAIRVKNKQRLPYRVTVAGDEKATAQFLSGFVGDQRPAGAALQHVTPDAVAAPWVSEAAAHIGLVLADQRAADRRAAAQKK